MIDGGALTITLARAGGRIVPRVDSPPMLSLTRMLAGKTVAEAAQLVGVVHAVAPSAEAAAVLAAVGEPVSDPLRRGMVIEALNDHLCKFNHAWPAALGLPGSHAPRLPARSDARALSLALFGPMGPPRRLCDLEAWIDAAPTPGALVVSEVWRHWDGRWGRAELPLWSADWALGMLDWNEGLMDGQPVETGIAARMADSDLAREVEARRGRGIAWRLAARLADAAALLDRLEDGDFEGLSRRLSPQVGAAFAPNGTLLVEVDCHGGVVTRYQRLSPADFALHPRGLLSRVLASLPSRSRVNLCAIATLGVESVDPALPTRVVLPDSRAAA